MRRPAREEMAPQGSWSGDSRVNTSTLSPQHTDGVSLQRESSDKALRWARPPLLLARQADN